MCAIFKAQFIQVFLTVLSQKTVVSRVFAWLLATDSCSAKQAFFTSMKMKVWRRLKCLTNQGLFCHFYCNVSVSLNRSCRSHFVCRPTSRDNLLSFINRVSLQSRLGTSPRRYRTSSFVSSFFYLTKGFFLFLSSFSNLHLLAWQNCARRRVAKMVVPQYHQPRSPSSCTLWSLPQLH